MSEFIAVKTRAPGDTEDDLAVPPDIAGAMISWTLAPNGVGIDDLVTTLAEAGFDESYIPVDPTPSQALLNMLNRMFKKATTLIRSVRHPRGVQGQVQATYAVVPKDEGEEDKVIFREEFKVAAVLVQKGEPGNTYIDSDLWFADEVPQDKIDTMLAEYPTYLRTMYSLEQSQWLTRLCKSVLKGIVMEGGSGHYFIEPSMVPIWRKLNRELRKLGIFLHEIPAMKSQQAVEAVLSSLRAMLTKSMEELETDLQKYAEKRNDPNARKVQRRVLEERQNRMNKDLNLIERYEQLFSVRLEDMRANLEKMQMGYAELATITSGES
jgi:uncharacterized protein Veg